MSGTEATVRAIHAAFNAKSVGLVGVSSDPRKFGYMALNTILGGGYEGGIYPVSPKGGELMGLKVYTSVSEIPVKLDLAVIVVSAESVPGVLLEAADKGAGAAAILSAGFREAGRPDLEDRIAAISLERGIRLMGPNIQGINYLPNKLCAMFFPVIKTKGPLAIVSQSGSVTAALSEWAADEGFGISAAVNLGNQVDICESDYLEFFAQDEDTRAIMMYLEGVKDGRRFLEVLEKVAPQKPIAICKAGRTTAGQKSAASHTGSLAGSHEVFEAACRQFGAVMAESVEALYDRAKALATLKRPKGNRVLTISSSGGAATLACDEAEAQGLSVPLLPVGMLDELKKLKLPALASLSNPIDLISLDSEHFKQVASLADKFDAADLLLMSFADPVPGAPEALKQLSAKLGASVAVSYMGGGKEEKAGRVEIQRAGIAVYPSPERAMQGIAAAVCEARYHRTPRERRQSMHVARYPVAAGAKDKSHFVPEPQAIELLAEYNIPYPEHGLAESAEEAAEVARKLGFPVVLKIVSPHVIHKSDMGGVRMDLLDEHAVREGFEIMVACVRTAVPEASIQGTLVCCQAEPGLEVIVGAIQDPVFGPTVMFGLGGVFAEVLNDVSFRIAPLSALDAEEMIHEIKGYPLLAGVRGRGPMAVGQLANLLLEVSRLVVEHPEMMELDLNPIRVYEQRLLALDARIIVRALPENPSNGHKANKRISTSNSC